MATSASAREDRRSGIPTQQGDVGKRESRRDHHRRERSLRKDGNLIPPSTRTALGARDIEPAGGSGPAPIDGSGAH